MRKLIAAINMTIDGFCDHTAITPDEEIHRHYEKVLLDAGVILYGRVTYQLMQYWQTLIEQPSGENQWTTLPWLSIAFRKLFFPIRWKVQDGPVHNCLINPLRKPLLN